MTTRIGINGFGRIGRQVLKALTEKYSQDLEVVAVNDLYDAKTNAHLFKYDSTYGTFPGTVEVKDGNLVIDGRTVRVFAEKDPGSLPWKDLGVQVVIEFDRGVHRRQPEGRQAGRPGAHREGRGA